MPPGVACAGPFDEAELLVRRSGDRTRLGTVLINRATWLSARHDLAGARQAYSAAADAYRELRRAQHRARLDEQPTQVPPASLAAQSDAVLALWRAVFD